MQKSIPKGFCGFVVDNNGYWCYVVRLPGETDNNGYWCYVVRLPGETTRRKHPLRAPGASAAMRSDRPRELAVAAAHRVWEAAMRVGRRAPAGLVRVGRAGADWIEFHGVVHLQGVFAREHGECVDGGRAVSSLDVCVRGCVLKILPVFGTRAGKRGFEGGFIDTVCVGVILFGKNCL